MSDNTEIDPAGLARLNRIGGSEFVKEMIRLFLEEAPERLSAARHAEKSGDLFAVAQAAHALKSSAQNFGAAELSRLAQQIEKLTQDNKDEHLAKLLDDMEHAFRNAKVWLEKERDALDP